MDKRTELAKLGEKLDTLNQHVAEKEEELRQLKLHTSVLNALYEHAVSRAIARDIINSLDDEKQ